MEINDIYLVSIKKQMLYYKTVAEKAIDQLKEEQLFVSINDEKEIIIEKDDIESSFEQLGFIKFENDLWFDSKGEKYFSSLDILIQNPSIIESLFKDKGELLMQLSGTNVLFIKDNRLFSSSFEMISFLLLFIWGSPQ